MITYVPNSNSGKIRKIKIKNENYHNLNICNKNSAESVCSSGQYKKEEIKKKQDRDQRLQVFKLGTCMVLSEKKKYTSTNYPTPLSLYFFDLRLDFDLCFFVLTPLLSFMTPLPTPPQHGKWWWAASEVGFLVRPERCDLCGSWCGVLWFGRRWRRPGSVVGCLVGWLAKACCGFEVILIACPTLFLYLLHVRCLCYAIGGCEMVCMVSVCFFVFWINFIYLFVSELLACSVFNGKDFVNNEKRTNILMANILCQILCQLY